MRFNSGIGLLHVDLQVPALPVTSLILRQSLTLLLSEYALEVRNPFIGVYHDRNAGVLVRKPIPDR